MQSARKPAERKSKEKINEDKPKLPDDKLRNSTSNVTTPRNFMPRSSAADIYAQKRKSDRHTVQKTPRKVPGTSNDSKTSPMKDLLKSTPSSISQISSSSKISVSSKTSKISNVKPRTAKDLPFVNVTVNSPIAKRKLAVDKTPRGKETIKAKEKTSTDLKLKDNSKNTTAVVKKEKENDRGDAERQRTKTRTLNDNEVKQLTPDQVDNNDEMMNLRQKLLAKPKAFYVDLDGDTPKVKPDKSSDEEVSYEDDFESYESDFDSYHSEKSNENTSDDAHEMEDGQNGGSETSDALKDVKDEENMLDSGNFDLRDQRSAKSKPAAMEFILEASEDDKVSSLDEGFQDGSSGVSSMKTVQVDVLDRPLVDFTKSREKKRKKQSFEKMMQRAKDILSMVTLHEMSFTLFEMKPISYDLYMATFGRTNHTQVAVQTFEDGVSEEVQTEEVSMDSKWTQFPVKFSKFDVYLNDESEVGRKKSRRNSEDYLSKFTFLFDERIAPEIGNDLNALKQYKDSPLRVLLEQKHGVGDCEMLPYEVYKNKLNVDFSMNRLGRFLKKVESNVSAILNSNTNAVLDNVVKSTFPFSSGYIGITTKKVSEEKSFLKQLKIFGVIFSESKPNFVMTVHRKATDGIVAGKCVVCLWDASVARAEPLKILIAIDNVAIGRFRGSTDGILVAALQDGSMHLWDLSEAPTWRNEVAKSDRTDSVVRTESTHSERDREWNLKNNDTGYEQPSIPFALQACAYTSSAANLSSPGLTGHIVGLEFVGSQTQDGGRRVVGQLCSLQRLGILTIWTIMQEKSNTHDLGKAFWSKMKLERTQTISLTDHISVKEMDDNNSSFNLNAGKKRMLNRKQEKTLARNFSRQKSTDSSRDRPASAASARKIPVEKILPHDWETGVVCSDLKILQYDGADRYLVAKNYGEVLSCTRSSGALRVERLCVSTDTSDIRCLEASPHEPAYFLAATDSGAVHLYSMQERRVLLTLDCRNAPPPAVPRADFKGQFVEAPRAPAADTHLAAETKVMSLLWSRVNPCCIFTVTRQGALGVWELTHSDIYPKYIGGRATFACMAADGTLALVTAEGEAQLHQLVGGRRVPEYRQLFHKYVALL